MQFSGYDKRFRTQVVRSALNAYDKMVEKDANGEEPMYRPRSWKRVERAKNRRAKMSEWFKGGGQGNETVIFVPATPDSELKRRYQKVITAAKVKVAVAEVPGASLKRRLQKSDPFRESNAETETNVRYVEREKEEGAEVLPQHRRCTRRLEDSIRVTNIQERGAL